MTARNLSSCLACGAADLIKILDLGDLPLANELHLQPVSQDRFPLVLVLCRSCFHSQLSVAIQKERLYENYLYVSGTTATLDRYFASFASDLRRSNPTSYVCDLAANDGSFVRHLQAVGLKALGIEPARNLAIAANNQGLPIINEFWNSRTAAKYSETFDVITAMNVLAHVDDPLDFLVGCASAIKPNGSIFVQTSQARMFERSEFDCIYHEHHSYFNSRSMNVLALRANLSVKSVCYVDIHGTSYLWELRKQSTTTSNNVLENEIRAGLFEISTYERFAHESLMRAQKAQELIEQFRDRGYLVSIFGAAAKSATFLNFARISPDIVVDDNSLKQSRIFPGTRVFIDDPTSYNEIEKSILHVLGAWNFASEISQKIKKLRPESSGDYVLTYFPELHVERL